MSENTNVNDEYIDINSSTPKTESKSKAKANKRIQLPDFGKHIEKYGHGLFKHMGGIIKFIAFVICFAIVIVSFIAAYFFHSNSNFGKILTFSIVGGGTAIALIILFMIYGVGHIICQNNVIITRLNQILRNNNEDNK